MDARWPDIGKVAPGPRGCACGQAGDASRAPGAWSVIALGLAAVGRARRRRPALPAAHDLLVIATGRGGLADLFPVVPEWSPLSAPARRLCTAFYHGIAPHDGMNAVVHIAPGAGELFV